MLAADPFETLDRAGVGRLVAGACRDARDARPDIKLGICGEQAGDPASVRFLVDCGVDYLSCSPYRVPIARLAVAQALLAARRVSADVLVALVALVANEANVAHGSEEDAEQTAMVCPPIDAEFLVLHALRIKGFAAAGAVAELTGLDAAAVASELARLVEAGHARHIAARDLYQLQPPGRERHATLLATVPQASVAGLREHYATFLDLNLAFKDLCTAWQTRAGEPNDHTDAVYDAARIDELGQLHERAEPVLRGFAGAVARFDSYRHRLATALARAAAGESRMFTGVMCGSYHDVWMELHEDLIQLLGVDRHAEGSF